MDNQKEVKIEEWIDRCINGSGGLLAMEKYEWGIRLDSDEIVAASWILRCLANPECEGSEDVLQAIIERRKEILNMKNPKKQEPYYYEIDRPVLAFWEDKWQNGRIIHGYRTHDGLVNVQLDNGQKLWFGEARHEEYIKPL